MKIIRDYQPEVFGVIVALAALNIWYFSSVAIEESVVPKSYDYLIRTFTVAIGAFIGAFSAFWLKSYEEGKKDKKYQKQALNSGLFVLIRQINAIQCIKRDLDKYKTPFDRGLSLPAMKPPDYSNLTQKPGQRAIVSNISGFCSLTLFFLVGDLKQYSRFGGSWQSFIKMTGFVA